MAGSPRKLLPNNPATMRGSLQLQRNRKGGALCSTGTPPINSFFTPCGGKRKEVVVVDDAENRENGAQPPAKRRRTKGDGTSQSPLRILESSDERSKSSKLSSDVEVVSVNVASKTAKKPTEVTIKPESSETPSSGLTPAEGVGLVRIHDSTLSPEGLSYQSNEVHGLFTGAILGRNLSLKPVKSSVSKRAKNKIDLCISSEAIGVSRKHLEVVSIANGSVTMRQFPSVKNPVVIHRYSHASKTMSTKAEPAAIGKSITLHPGDVIELDAYNSKLTPTGDQLLPQHVFRLVTTSLNCASQANRTSAASLPVKSEMKKSLGAVKNLADEPSGIVAGQIEDVNTGVTEHQDTKVLPQKPTEAPTTVEFSRYKETPSKPSPVVDTSEKPISGVSTENVEAVKHDFSDAPRPEEMKVQGSAGNVEREETCLEDVTMSKDAETPATEAAKTSELDSIPAKGSTNVVSVSPAIRPPAAGERFRVLFDDYTNMFGTKSSTWFFGFATKVSRKNSKKTDSNSEEYLVNMTFDDNSTTTVSFPARDVQRIKADAGSAMFYAEHMPRNTKESFAYDANPGELAVGDLVDCHYQNGTSRGAWYRGRVAAISESTATCEVAYDDGEYECDVPIRGENFHLVERGLDDCSWLARLAVHEEFKGQNQTRGKARKKSCRRGKIVKVARSDTNSASFKVKFSDETCEWTYNQVVTALFAFHRDECSRENKIKSWPVRVQESKMVAPDDEEHVAMSQNSYASYPDDLNEEKGPSVTTMHPSLANSLWRALNSAEPHFGADLLTLMTTCHEKVPPNALGQNLFDLMVHGPRSEGTEFPDPNRMELAANYVSLLASKPLLMDSLSASMGPSSWEDFQICVQQATNEIYRAPGDASRLTPSAVNRIGDSLQVAASAANAVVVQLECQLRGFIQNDSATSNSGYRAKPIVQAVLACRDGIRDSLKSVVRMNARSWLHNGHFLLNDLTVLEVVDDANDISCVQFCGEEAKRLLDAFGKVTSYLSWLYCAEEGIGIGDQSCAYLIKDAFLTELENRAFDPSPFIAKSKGKKSAAMEKYLKKLKLWFLLSLDDSFMPPLRSKLASLLGLSKELAIVCV